MSYSNQLNQFDSFSWGDAPDFFAEDFDAAVESTDTINLENITLGQLNDLVERYGDENPEWVGALISGIASLAPVVIQGIQSLTNRPSTPPRPAQQQAPRPQPRPMPQRPQVRPNYAPTRPSQTPIIGPGGLRPTNPISPQALNPQPLPPSPPNIGVANNGGAINTLVGLLNNPSIQQLIGGLVGGNNSANLSVGGAEIPVGTILNTISQLANMVNSETLGEQLDSYPNFLFDNQGNLLAEPNSPEEVGELILSYV